MATYDAIIRVRSAATASLDAELTQIAQPGIATDEDRILAVRTALGEVVHSGNAEYGQRVDNGVKVAFGGTKISDAPASIYRDSVGSELIIGSDSDDITVNPPNGKSNKVTGRFLFGAAVNGGDGGSAAGPTQIDVQNANVVYVSPSANDGSHEYYELINGADWQPIIVINTDASNYAYVAGIDGADNAYIAAHGQELGIFHALYWYW